MPKGIRYEQSRRDDLIGEKLFSSFSGSVLAGINFFKSEPKILKLKLSGYNPTF